MKQTFSKMSAAALNIQLIQRFKEYLPKLGSDMHKGQSGKVAIVGGSKEYSGAPYFASISSLRVGADLAYVFTTKDAASVIKSYSPEMIVLPILDAENNELDIRTWISKTTSVVIGPGLGRSETAFNSLKTALNCAKNNNLPVVIDADGLFVLTYDMSLVKGYQKCILTPNFMEFKRLYEHSVRFSSIKFQNEYNEKELFNTLELQCKAVKKLAENLENVTIIKKGEIDIISDGREVVCNGTEGSPKRCGGIGDLLTGTLGTFLFWSDQVIQNSCFSSDQVASSQPNILAAYAGSVFVRECSRLAYRNFHRATLAIDIIEQIPETFYKMFDKQ